MTCSWRGRLCQLVSVYLLASPTLLYCLCHTGSGALQTTFLSTLPGGTNVRLCQQGELQRYTKAGRGRSSLLLPFVKQWTLSLRFRCMPPQQPFFTPATAGHSHSSILIQGAVLTLPESSLTPVKQHSLTRCPSFSSKEDLLQVSKF